MEIMRPPARLRAQIGLITIMGVLALLTCAIIDGVTRLTLNRQAEAVAAAQESLSGMNAIWRSLLFVRQTEADALSNMQENSLRLHEAAVSGLRAVIAAYVTENPAENDGVATLREGLEAYELAFSAATGHRDGDAAAAAAHAIQITLERLDTATEAALLEPLGPILAAAGRPDNSQVTHLMDVFTARLAAAPIPDSTRSGLAARLAEWQRNVRQPRDNGVLLHSAAAAMADTVADASRIANNAVRQARDALSAMQKQSDRLIMGVFTGALMLMALGGTLASRAIARPIEDIAASLCGPAADGRAFQEAANHDTSEATRIARTLTALRDRPAVAAPEPAAPAARRVDVVEMAQRIMTEIAAKAQDQASESVAVAAAEIRTLTGMTVQATDDIDRQIATIEAVSDEGRKAA